MILLRRLYFEEEGQNLVEYTVTIGLVVLIIWSAIQTVGINTFVSGVWSKVTSSLTP